MNRDMVRFRLMSQYLVIQAALGIETNPNAYGIIERQVGTQQGGGQWPPIYP